MAKFRYTIDGGATSVEDNQALPFNLSSILAGDTITLEPIGAAATLAGSSGLPAFAFNDNEMLLGMGLAGIASYNGYYPFANVAWSCLRWIQKTGAGTYTQEFGTITTTDPTATFYAKFAEGTGVSALLPAGTYTVLNPDSCEIGIGAGDTPTITGWTTATSFTCTLSGAVVSLCAKGNVTNINGPIQIIMPGRLSAFQAGDYWNPAFITFLSGLNVNCLRFMDWLVTYSDITEDWSEVPSGLPIMLCAKTTIVVGLTSAHMNI